ncbi:TonB-dependent receptor [Massilia terrae]|uniref:TonB-dependent receptor n=1 Tax=Massilia terrae TaxID=1811224 RepID=A0ABT2CS67_9BURK|nr:TonB-dependent receptor [Massilia terrae]MCS0656786.1 TonB-dependent receptor [Massilia terrae]
MKRKNVWIGLSKPLACGTALGLSAMLGAHAQEAPVPAPAATSATSAEPIQSVVITGSKIARRDYSSPSPIVTTSKDVLQEGGAVTLEAALNQLPQFTPSGTDSTGTQGTGARATLDLRGLGDNRNLVLLDGRRLPLSSAFGQVDINILPPAIIDGVETITGGASAVYGSDAMSGVVNFKTMRKFEGVMLDVQYGNSQKRDLARKSPSLAAGARFADGRGYALLSLSYDERQELRGTSRPFFALGVPSSYIGTSTYVPAASNLPSQAAINSVFSSYGITATVPRTNNLGFNDNGSLFSQTGAVNYKGPLNGNYVLIGGNVRMPVLPQSDLLHALRRENLFNKLEFRFTPDVTGYTQLLHTHSVANTSSGGSLTQFGLGANTTVPLSNPFIPNDLRTILASRPDPNAPFLWNTRFVGIPAKNWDEGYTTDQLIVGVRGNIPYKDWTFDAYVETDRSVHDQTMNNAVLSSRVQQLLNAADGGRSVCAGGFNPFGIANSLSLSDSCRNYLSTSTLSKEELTQRMAEASVQGTLFEAPAGDVQFSASANYRKNTYNYLPDSELAAQNIEAVIASQRSSGQTAVKEVAVELRVPLLKDVPFARTLALSPGARLSDYDISGVTKTHKIELEWSPLSNTLVRGGLQHAIRAPNIGELFSAATGAQVQFGSPPNGGEPCDVRTTARSGANAAAMRALCIATGVPANVVDSYTFPTVATSTVSSGNRDLKPETADTKTLGLVLTPQFDNPLFSQVSASVDVYDIKIKDTISAVPAASALNKCYNLDGSNPSYSPTNPFCQLISRDANGLLTQVAAPYLNLGLLKTSGVDVQLDWHFKLAALGLPANWGSFGVNTGANFLHSYQSQALPGDAIQEFKGTVSTVVRPSWQATTTFRYELGGLSAMLRWRHLPAMKDITSVTRPASPTAGVAKYDIADLTLNYAVSKNTTLRGGITNLFNRDPASVPGNQNLTVASTYDIVGRAFFVGVRTKF